MNTKSNMAAWRVALGATFLSAATCMAADIPARGGVVPDGSGTDVSITSAGADGAGPITLEKSSTSVKSLVQRTGVDAVVDLGGGTLAAGAVGVAGEDSASLVVGSAPGDGALAPLSGALAFSNESTNGARLVVNSAVATSSSDTISVSGPGETHVVSDFAHAGTLQLDGGTFSVTNAATITATLKGSGAFAKEGLTTFKMPNVDFKDFTGEIVFRAGTNGFYNNSRLSTGKYRYRFEPSSQIDTTSGWYDTAGTHVSAAGDGVYGDGVAVVTASGNARTFPYFTLTGDASVNPSHQSSWIQLGGSIYSKIFGLFDMGGHTLTKRDGSGYLRFENGAITNAGLIVLADYTGSYAEYSRIVLNTNFSLGGPGSPPIYMGAKTSIRMVGSMAQNRSIVVRGKDAKVLVTPGYLDADQHSWQGVGVENAGDSLAMRPELATGRWKLDILGPISGSGLLVLGVDGTNFKDGRMVLGGENGTFDGILTANVVRATIVARHPSFVPDYSKVSVFGAGGFGLSVANWSKEQMYDFAETATLDAASYIGLDVEAGDRQSISGLKMMDSNFMWMKTGDGVLDFSSPATAPFKVGAKDGTLRITGADRVDLCGVVSEGADAGGTPGNVLIDGASDVLLSLTNGAAFFVGSQSQTRDVPARAAISNSCVQSWTVLNGDKQSYTNSLGKPDFYGKGIVVGGYSCGALEVGTGAAVTNRLVVGGNNATSRGGVYVRDGRFCNLGSIADGDCVGGVGLGSGDGAYGYLEVTGGRYEQMGAQTIAASGSTGIMHVDGGYVKTERRGESYNPNTSWVPQLNLSYNGHSVLDVASGTFKHSPGRIYTCRAGTSTAVLTVGCDGRAASLETSEKVSCGWSQSSTTILNFNSGAAVQTPGFEKYRTTTTAGWSGMRAYLNFNGGKFSMVGSGWMFGNPWQEDGKGGAAMDAVTVFENGAKLATTGASYEGKAGPLVAPSGKGLTAVDMGTLGTNVLVGPPRIVISGDGWGASAYADFDSRSGRVTGIRVTSHGCDYTEASASAYYGKTLLAENLTVTLADNVGGGITKTGLGTVILAATNTYSGATTIESGTLRAGTDRAIPSGSELVLAGGTLDLGGFEFEFGGVSGTSGTVVNGTVKIGGSWVVDCADLVAGTVPVLAGNVAFLPGATLRFSNEELLSDTVRYRVLRVTGGGMSGLDNLAVEAPPHWHVAKTADSLTLKFQRGSVIMVW